MTQELMISRLQSLLERVHTRAKQERVRPARDRATQTHAAPATPRVAALPPVVMALTADSAETDETRPFAKLTPGQLGIAVAKEAARVEPPVPVAARHPTEPPPALDFEALEPEPALLEAPQPVALEPEPPASSRRPAQEHPLDLEELSLEAEVPEERHDTEPPKSGPIVAEKPAEGAVAAAFEVDFEASRLDRAQAEAPVGPSESQLGQMLELEELPEGAQEGIELAPPPKIEEAPSTLHEMEAPLPSAQKPGVYSAEIASTTAPSSPEGVFGAEPRTGEWELPAQKAVSGVIDAAAAHAAKPAVVAEKAAVEQKPAAALEAEATTEEAAVVEPTLQEERAPEQPAAALPAEPLAAPAPGRLRLVAQRASEPVELEVVPVVVAPMQVATADVAVFMGAVHEFKPATFVEWLDATLELGSK